MSSGRIVLGFNLHILMGVLHKSIEVDGEKGGRESFGQARGRGSSSNSYVFIHANLHVFAFSNYVYPLTLSIFVLKLALREMKCHLIHTPPQTPPNIPATPPSKDSINTIVFSTNPWQEACSPTPPVARHLHEHLANSDAAFRKGLSPLSSSAWLWQRSPSDRTCSGRFHTPR